MKSLFRFLAPPSRCEYLPGQTAMLEYEQVLAFSPREYLQRMRSGWRRFGTTVFRPQCPACNACRSLRVLAERFVPNRSQQRALRLNAGAVRLQRGEPTVSAAKLRLYDRYHAYQVKAKGWPDHPAKDPDSYTHSFVDNPFPTQEWCYYLGERLIGVGYVDDLPGALSAIYFYYDPEERARSLGTWNILCIIEYARQRGIPHVYLGYYVADCPSLAYKGKFRPHELLGADGRWRGTDGKASPCSEGRSGTPRAAE